MQTAAEAEADSPGNPEEEPPAGNPDTRLPLQTSRGITISATCLGMSERTHFNCFYFGRMW